MLFQHIFWFFGHPEVYIIFIPALGFVSAIVVAHARARDFGYPAMVLSQSRTGSLRSASGSITCLPGFPQIGEAYLHRLEHDDCDHQRRSNLLLDRNAVDGRIRYPRAMHFVYGFIAIFVLGGLTGVMLASVPLDLQVHDLLKFAAAICGVPGGPGKPLWFRALSPRRSTLLVSSGVTSLIIEYQPAPFGKPEAEVLEWVLLALVGLPVVSSRKIDRYQLAHVLVWLHLALTSIRNAPLFALAAAPALAALLDGLPLSLRRSWKRDDRASVWPAAATILLADPGAPAGSAWADSTPRNGRSRRWRRSTVNPPSARLFHEQDWGGLIEAECRPVRRSYLDDRFELFGKEAIVEYIDVLTGGPAWDTVRDRDRIDLVWLRPDRGLAKRLLKEPGWSVLHRDKVSILFRHARARPIC